VWVVGRDFIGDAQVVEAVQRGRDVCRESERLRRVTARSECFLGVAQKGSEV